MLLKYFDHVSGDVSYYQPATQSVTYTDPSGVPQIAEYAVDFDPHYETCAFANNDVNGPPAWWMVDLGDLYSVTSVWLLATTAGRIPYVNIFNIGFVVISI